MVALAVLPAVALLLACASAFLKWHTDGAREDDAARVASVEAAKDSVIAILSYTPDKVETQLESARNLLTGDFRVSYSKLTDEVVIPGAKQKRVAAVATVPAATSVSADATHAVVLVLVDQTVTMGDDAPTETASSVRITLEKQGSQWLISAFDPV